MVNTVTYFIYDEYYQVIKEVTEEVENLKLTLSGVHIVSDPVQVKSKVEKTTLVEELTKMQQQLTLAEMHFNQASKNYEAGYVDYDVNSKAYILDHALSSIESAINLITPFCDFPIANKFKVNCNRLKESICKERPAS